MPKLIVQLVTWNGAKYVSDLFGSLKTQTYQDWELHILDNASSDDMVAQMKDELKDFPVPYRFTEQKENLGFAGGHNSLFQKGESEYVLLLNQDMLLAQNCFEQLIAFLEMNSSYDVASPRLMKWDFENKDQTATIDSLGLKGFHSGRVVEQYTAKEWEDIKNDLPEKILPVFGASGTLPIFRRATLETVAFDDGTFFDESYHSYKEDVDLAYRLTSAGFSTAIVLDAVAHHDRSAAGPKVLDDKAAAKNKRAQSSWVRYHSYKNHLMTLYKNLYWQNFLLDILPILWYEIKKFVWFLLFDRSVLKGLAEVWKQRKQLRAKRHIIKKKRTQSWKQVRKRIFV